MDTLTLERWKKIIANASSGTRLKGTTEAFARGVTKSVARHATLASRATTVFMVCETYVGGRKIKGIHMIAGGRKILVSLSALQAKTISNKDKALSAMRCLISEQIEDYRELRAKTLGTNPLCPLSGKDLRKCTKRHVDHYSISFSQLAKDWAELSAVDFNEIPTKGKGMGMKFKCDKLNSSWQAYHLAHADLKLVDAKANMSKGKKQLKSYLETHLK